MSEPTYPSNPILRQDGSCWCPQCDKEWDVRKGEKPNCKPCGDALDAMERPKAEILTRRAAFMIETEALSDSLHSLIEIHAALAKRHGPQFRALEKKIEAMTEGRVCASSVSIVCGRIMAHASPELAAVLKEARSLGVIQ